MQGTFLSRPPGQDDPRETQDPAGAGLRAVTHPSGQGGGSSSTHPPARAPGGAHTGTGSPQQGVTAVFSKKPGKCQGHVGGFGRWQLPDPGSHSRVCLDDLGMGHRQGLEVASGALQSLSLPAGEVTSPQTSTPTAGWGASGGRAWRKSNFCQAVFSLPEPPTRPLSRLIPNRGAHADAQPWGRAWFGDLNGSHTDELCFPEGVWPGGLEVAQEARGPACLQLCVPGLPGREPRLRASGHFD